MTRPASPAGALREAARPVRLRMAGAVLAAAAALTCGVALMATSAWLIARAAAHPPVLTLMVAVVAVRAFGLGRAVLRYVERIVAHEAAFRMLAALRGRIVSALVRWGERGRLWRRSDLLARTVDDVQDTQFLLLRGILPLAAAVVVGSAAVVLAIALLPAAGLVLAGSLIAGVVVTPLVLARRAAAVEQSSVTLRAQRTELVAQTVEQLTDLVALGAFDQALDRLSEIDDRQRCNRRAAARLAGIAAAVGTAVTGIAAVTALLVGVPAVRADDLTGPALAVLVLTPLALSEAVTAAGGAREAIARTAAAAARVAAMVTTDSEPEADGPRIPATQPSPGWRAGGPLIALEGVSARWPGAAVDALQDVHLELRPGLRLGVFGDSGSGKSTLAAVLLGLLPTSSGRITIDGRKVNVDQLREGALVSWVDQRAHVFATSIAENIRLARPAASDGEVLAAARSAGLWPWLAELPRGLATPVGERGQAVSGGQRQRIALARALLADRPVLIADEVTAHLDPAAADQITADLLADRRRCTVLLTHREHDANLVDQVLRLGTGHRGQCRPSRPPPPRSVSLCESSRPDSPHR